MRFTFKYLAVSRLTLHSECITGFQTTGCQSGMDITVTVGAPTPPLPIAAAQFYYSNPTCSGQPMSIGLFGCMCTIFEALGQHSKWFFIVGCPYGGAGTVTRCSNQGNSVTTSVYDSNACQGGQASEWITTPTGCSNYGSTFCYPGTSI